MKTRIYATSAVKGLRLRRNHIFPVCLIILILVCLIQLDFGIYYMELIEQVKLAFVI